MSQNGTLYSLHAFLPRSVLPVVAPFTMSLNLLDGGGTDCCVWLLNFLSYKNSKAAALVVGTAAAEGKIAKGVFFCKCQPKMTNAASKPDILLMVVVDKPVLLSSQVYLKTNRQPGQLTTTESKRDE